MNEYRQKLFAPKFREHICICIPNAQLLLSLVKNYRCMSLRQHHIVKQFEKVCLNFQVSTILSGVRLEPIYYAVAVAVAVAILIVFSECRHLFVSIIN